MTTATEAAGLVGADVDRVDGPSKVTGAARYPADFGLENLAHAVLVQSTVAAGRIRRMATAAAEAAPGVLTVITHRNAPRLARAPGGLGIGPPPPLQDDRVVHHGQHIAVVVAQTLEQAAAAARLVETGYETAEPLLDLDDPRAERVDNAAGRDVSRGDVAAGLAAAEVIVAATYTTPVQTNNPLGLFATIASWDGDLLTVHDSTQGPAFARTALAVAFGLPETAVRVLAPFVGGAFGAGLRTWPHVVLAALAARVAGRPVKLVLSRAQMFTSVGYRPPAVQHLTLGARRTGELVAIDHQGIEPTALEDDYAESLTRATAVLYDCPNLSGRTRQVRLNVACPTWMRGPGEAPGVFALECALDELACELGMDPVRAAAAQLRRGSPADRPAVVEQGAARVLRAGRGTVRLGAPHSRAALDERRPVPGRIRDGQRLLRLRPGALPGQGVAGPGRGGGGTERGHRHRPRHLHGHDPGRRRRAGPAARAGPVRTRRQHHAAGAAAGRIRADRRAQQRGAHRLPGAAAGLRRAGGQQPSLAPVRLRSPGRDRRRRPHQPGPRQRPGAG